MGLGFRVFGVFRVLGFMVFGFRVFRVFGFTVFGLRV